MHIALTCAINPLSTLEQGSSDLLPIRDPDLQTTTLTNVSVDQAVTVLRQSRKYAVA